MTVGRHGGGTMIGAGLGFVVVLVVSCTPDTQSVGWTSTTDGGTTAASSGTGTTTGADGTSATSVATNDGSSTSMGMDSSDPNTSTDGTGGEPPPPTYPPCSDERPRCPEEYDGCVEPGNGSNGMVCTSLCDDASECPLPESGSASVRCAAPMGADPFCQLDCSEGECPEGMVCVGLGPAGNAMRCLWPPG